MPGTEGVKFGDPIGRGCFSQHPKRAQRIHELRDFSGLHHAVPLKSFVSTAVLPVRFVWFFELHPRWPPNRLSFCLARQADLL